MKIAVIISTYNAPQWLQKVLWGYEQQIDKDFALIIADDGSNSETKELVEQFIERGNLQIQHVWHEDNGFQKTIILNKAIQQCDADYIINTDGDCIPRFDFISTHRKYAREKYFLSGGYFKLNMPVSKAITEEDIQTGRAFDYKWLRQQGQSKKKTLKLRVKGFWAKFFNFITPTKATWNGMNSSTLKKHILAVNGFNEDMQYGGLDRELGERLMNAGIRGKQIRHSAICLHLDHKRGYATKETWEKNKAIRKRVKDEKITWVENGMTK